MWFFLAFLSFVGGVLALVGVAFPRAVRLSRRLHALALFALAFVAWVVTMVLGVGADNERQQRERQERETAAAVEAVPPTMAEAWVATARGDLGMRDEHFFVQMPDDLVGARWGERQGASRVHTMTWPDGSVVVTHWRPSEVRGDGLRLFLIEQVGQPH